jgi:hypothetical protein
LCLLFWGGGWRGAAEDRWYSVGDVTEAAFHWLGLKDSFC